MPPTLPDQLRRIKSRVRQLLCLYGASWLVVVVFGATLAVGFLDWLVHLDDPGVRLILGLTILGGGLWVAWRRLIAPLLTVRRYSDIDVAKQVERRYPGFRDSLASTVQFLKDDASPQIGSPALQRHVIDSTLRQASRIDASDVVETRGVRRVALAATIVCLVTALVVGLNQVAAATALGRLLSPFSHRPWPRTTELVLFDAKFEPLGRHLRVARGESLEIVIENARGPLPRDLAMEYRYGESEQARERLRRTTRRDAGGRSREIGVATFVADRGPIRFRAIGGDDDEMPWHVLEVVPPPELESLQATLTPPAYAGAQPERLPAGVGHVQGLVGTRVEIAGVAGKPLGSAVLRVKDDPPVAVGPGPGRELKASFVIRDAGVYSWWLDLEDRQGFANPDAPRYEIRGIADQIPQVSIEEPASSMLVTPDAEIPLRISARDDLGLKLVRLVYRIGDSPDIAASGRVLAEPSERPLELLVSESWRLAELSLGPGVSVVFHAEAVDWFDLGPEHVGRSIPRTLTIVAPEEKRAELADRHGGLLDELEEALQSERRVWEQTGELIEQLDIVGRLRPQDIDLLKRVELDQRQVASRLHNPAGGVAARAERLQQELQANRIDDADMARRLKQLLEELQILRDEHLPPIDRELTRARKGAQPELQRESSAPGADASGSQEEAPAARDARAQSEALAAARDHQDAVVRSLEDLVEQMNRWRSRQNLGADLRELIGGQKGVGSETAELRSRIPASKPIQLPPQQRADLSRLAGRQRAEADRAAQFLRTLERTIEDLRESGPDAADAVRDVRDEFERLATESLMRQAASDIEENHLGEAAMRQQQTLERLAELDDLLHERGGPEGELLLKKLGEAESQLETLRKKQEELLKESQAAANEPDAERRAEELKRLAKEQQELRREVEGLARRLRRLESRPAAAAARRAGERLREAEERLEKDDDPQAAAHEQAEALDDLEQAQREIARQRQEEQERLAREMLERIADELKAILPRQQNVLDETLRLRKLKDEEGRLTRAQLITLSDLAAVERGLKDETDRLAQTVEAAEVFALALRGAARHIERAAVRLADKQLDDATLAAERAALARFQALVAALESEGEQNQQPQQDPQQRPRPNDQGGPQTDGIPHLAQLRMLKSLQEELLARTAQLDELHQDVDELSEDQQAELKSIAEEQQQLSDLARNLTRQVAATFETRDPEPAQAGPQE